VAFGSGFRQWLSAVAFGSGFRQWLSAVAFGSGFRQWASNRGPGGVADQDWVRSFVYFERHVNHADRKLSLMNPFRSWKIAARGRELTAIEGSPLLAGILNVTPDSFYDGGTYQTVDRAVMQAGLMYDAGAAIIDVGGASSRPRGKTYGRGAVFVPPETELARVLPVVKTLVSDFPEIVVSIDTFHPVVAEACLEAGAHIINDITALRLFPEMAETVARHDAALILMHSTGAPGEMAHAIDHGDVIRTVREELAIAVDVAKRAGVRSIVTDPGFGFGKTTTDNFRLINEIDEHRVEDHPVMIGVSRKSSIGAALVDEQFPAPAFERLFGSLGATAVGVFRGAAVVRTHDVAATAELVRVMSVTLGLKTNNFFQGHQ
jgi:dihydropteroate synthase